MTYTKQQKASAANAAKGRAARLSARSSDSESVEATQPSSSPATSSRTSTSRTLRPRHADLVENPSFDEIDEEALDEDALPLAPTPPPSLQEAVMQYKAVVGALEQPSSMGPTQRATRSGRDDAYETASSTVRAARTYRDDREKWMSSVKRFREASIMFATGSTRSSLETHRDRYMIEIECNSYADRDHTLEDIKHKYNLGHVHFWMSKERQWCARVEMLDSDNAANLVDKGFMYSDNNGRFLARLAWPTNSSLLSRDGWASHRLKIGGATPSQSQGSIQMLLALFETRGTIEEEADSSVIARFTDADEAFLAYVCLHRLPLLPCILNVQPL